MANAIYRRLVNGAAAGTFGQAVTIGGQLLSVPLLLAAWGPQVYGDWLLLTAAPWLLSFLDLGLVQATSNRMTALAAADNEPAARRLLDATWSSLSILCVGFGLCLAVAISVVDIHTLISTGEIPADESKVILLLGTIWVMLSFQMGVLQCPFRARGRFAEGLWWYHGTRGAELIACLIAAVFFNPVVSMGALVITRFCLVICLSIRGHYTHGINPRWRLHLSEIAKLIPPSLGSVCLGVSHAVYVHGSLIVIGHHFDAATCAQYATIRTLARVPLQLLVVLLWPMQSEVSMMIGRNETASVGRAWRFSVYASLGLGIGYFAALITFGQDAFILWTHGTVSWDPGLASLLGLATLATCLWNALLLPTQAANAHLAVSVGILLITLGYLGAVHYMMSAQPHLALAALAGVVCEALIVPLSWIASRRSCEARNT